MEDAVARMPDIRWRNFAWWVVLTIGVVGDAVTTWMGIASGALKELNPLGIATMSILGLGGGILVSHFALLLFAGGVHWHLGDHDEFVTVVLAILAMAFLIIFANNLLVLTGEWP